MLDAWHSRGNVRLVRARKTIGVLLTITESGMILDWALAIAMALGILSIPRAWMYSNHNDPTVVAWNWSFLPTDVRFAVTGLTTRFSTRLPGQFAYISLTLMLCAGLMALSRDRVDAGSTSRF